MIRTPRCFSTGGRHVTSSLIGYFGGRIDGVGANLLDNSRRNVGSTFLWPIPFQQSGICDRLRKSKRSGRVHRARLITPAPPIFTTSRARYNRFARRYVAILELAFIAIVFFPNLLA